MPPTQLSAPLKSHFEVRDSLRYMKLLSKFLVFYWIWSISLCKLPGYFQFRRGTHKPFGGVVIHLEKKGARGRERGAIRNSLRFSDDIRHRFLSLEKLWRSHISVHSQITGRALALNPPNAFLPKSVCSSFSWGFLFTGNMSVLNERLLWNGVLFLSD